MILIFQSYKYRFTLWGVSDVYAYQMAHHHVTRPCYTNISNLHFESTQSRISVSIHFYIITHPGCVILIIQCYTCVFARACL